MRSAGLDLIRYVITLTDGTECVQYASDPDTAVHLLRVPWSEVKTVEAR